MSAPVGRGGSEVNTIEQVSIDDHQMSLAGGSLRVPEVPCLVCVCGGGGVEGSGACTVSSNAAWIIHPDYEF